MKEKLLLEMAKQIIDKYKMIDEVNGLNFNLLTAGNVDTKETFHSFLIADLLNPKGIHNQGDKFLNLFLKEIGYKKSLKSPSVYPEYVINKYKRIDIVIEDNGKIEIAIEMKIYSTDSKNQLKDYYEYIKNKNKNSKLYYLTLYGEEPIDENNQNKYDELLSFKENISKWLEKCIKEVYNIPNIRESLLIYKNLIDKLTNNNLQKENEMIKLISQDAKSIESAANIYKNYEMAWATKEYEFWADLYNEIDKKIDNNWKDGDDIFYKNKSNYSIWYDENGKLLDEEEIINRIWHIRFGNSINKHIGIAFKKNIENYQIYCVIGCFNEHYCWIGIQIKDKNNNFLSGEKIKDFFEGENFNLEETDNESIYSVLENLKFASKNNSDGTFELFDKKEYKKIIKQLTNQMIELINKVDKKIKTLKK
jgi:hypothetical protein